MHELLDKKVKVLEHDHLHSDYFNLPGTIVGYRYDAEDPKKIEKQWLVRFDIKDDTKNKFGYLIYNRICSSLWLGKEMFEVL